MLHQLEKEGRKMTMEIGTTKNVLTGTDVLNLKKIKQVSFTSQYRLFYSSA